jgi:uncharacterized protein
MSCPVTWFEITSPSHEQLQGFYADLFGWKLQPLEGAGYTLVEGAEGGVPGGIGSSQGGPSQALFYIQVDDPQAYLDRIEAKGGKTVVPVTEIPDMVTFAQFSDPDGNVIGLVKA